jgi:hypothetical protein
MLFVYFHGRKNKLVSRQFIDKSIFQGNFMQAQPYFSEQKNLLRIRQDICPTIDSETSHEMTAYFQESLSYHHAMFAQTFTILQQKQLYFLAKNLLGAALYFAVPALQTSLKQLMEEASQDVATRELLNNVNLEIDRVLSSII